MQTEANELSSSDIGYATENILCFENGKCGFKLIQYIWPVVYRLAASALPLIKK
jgi:hypothetical protein